jgi:hypothetical protein
MTDFSPQRRGDAERFSKSRSAHAIRSVILEPFAFESRNEGAEISLRLCVPAVNLLAIVSPRPPVYHFPPGSAMVCLVRFLANTEKTEVLPCR